MEAETKVNISTTGAQESKGKRLPAHQFKAGPISAAIWANDAKKADGEMSTFYTITLNRVYKDKDDWKHTNSLRTNDLPRAQLVLQKAFEWLALAEQ